MKRFLISLAAGMALSAAGLYAQDFTTIRVHFDQAVAVSNNELPPGDYTITLTRSSAEEPVLHFQSDSGANILVIATRDERPLAHETAHHTAVMLDEDGPIAQVSRIQVAGDSTDLLLPMPTVHEIGVR